MTDREKKIEEIMKTIEIEEQDNNDVFATNNDDVRFLVSEIRLIQQERDKAVEGLKGYAQSGLQGAKDILSELGVSL